MYEKQLTQMSKHIEEMVTDNPEKPWEQIDTAMKSEGAKDKEFLKLISSMASGVIVSMCITEEKVMNTIEGHTKEEIDMIVTMACTEVVATCLLRAMALGIQAQKAVSEVELLESLAQQ